MSCSRTQHSNTKVTKGLVTGTVLVEPSKFKIIALLSEWYDG